jgi:glyoxylase-like metal-dependent hydrolase (beta-lactamase superfamily II)
VEVVPGIARFRDSCNVYALRSGRDATLIDVGTGAVFDRLDELGADHVTDVLVTHHHRDQVQGLARAVSAGAHVWVPPVERDLIAAVDDHWDRRSVENDYDLRQDRFSLLEQVPVAGTVDEYRTRRYGQHDVLTLPTPGHTIGSVSYLVEVGRRVAFVGDLLYGPGQVWSLAATQWTYTGVEGQAATVVSCGVLADRGLDLLLPSHGEPIEQPGPALALTQERLQELLELRHGERWDLDAWLHRPWAPVTPHLLRNRTCLAHSYALLSETGSALLIDWGYDLTTGTPAVTERAARRPLLASLDVLRRDFGVDRVEAVFTTHYHDDHVAGINLLRDVEGTEVWSPENVAPIIERPSRYDLPCLWFDPVPVDRVLALGAPVTWHEYELTPHPLPGHTLYAAALELEVDGKRVLATGDQQAGGPRPDVDIINYQYRNRFRFDDFVASAELYRSLRPDLIVTGHTHPREVDDAYLQRLLDDGTRVAELHRQLLPLDEFDLGGEGFAARIEPYRSTAGEGPITLDVTVRNPFGRPENALVSLAVPRGWSASPPEHDVRIEAHGETTVSFSVAADGPEQRGRVAADVTVGGVRFGQQAEALVEVE